MNKFDGVQRLILEDKNKNQLVSAGAGSGKTTIMIEKITNLILKENVNVDNLLVVTFTVLAAQEMKDRLIKKLKEQITLSNEDEKQKILDIIEQIKTASIDTIDGFSSKTIKKYFYELNISPNIEIISEASRDYFLTLAMRKTIDTFSKNLESVNLMLDLYGGNKRNFDFLKEMILTAYNNIITLKNYEKFLDDSINEYKDCWKSENVVNNYICKIAGNIVCKIIREISSFDSFVQNKLKQAVAQLQQFNIAMSFKTNLHVLNNLDLPTFSVKEFSENEGLKILNNEIKFILEIKASLEKNQIDENFEEKNEKISTYLTIFINLLKNFIKNYNDLKEKNNLIDFNDLNRLMLKLLNINEIRCSLQDKYKYIFIDEYQDVNPLQDELMSLISGDETKVFLVGDVKQSIYGFRGSSPEWFIEKYDNLKKDKSNGAAFDMNVNFRSSPTILNFINDIFVKLMTKELTDIDYKKDAVIEPKREDIIDDKVNIMLVQEKSDETVASGLYSVKNSQNISVLKSKNKEAMLVLKIISDLIGTEFYDANLKQNRKLTYKDIAILSRSEKDESARTLIDLLKNNAIPLNVNNKLEVNSSESIKLVLSILKCVSGLADDVDYLATFLSLTNLTIDDIVEIRDTQSSLYENLKNNHQDKNVEFGFDVIEKIRNFSYNASNDDVIRYILNDCGIKYFFLSKKNGEKQIKEIEEFLNKLSKVENSLNLCEFIEMVESNISKGNDFETIDNEDSVTIQTIHKSKGLEYPVVILFNSNKMFSYLRDNDNINYNQDIGFGLDYFDVANRVKMDSLTKFAIRIKNAEKGYKEELRLLYVALTRAKNKLFITGSYSAKSLVDGFSKNSFSNAILSCFEDQITDNENEFKNCKITLFEDVEELNSDDEYKNRKIDGKLIDFEYKNTEKFKIPFKNSVTGINSEISLQNKFETKKWINTQVQYSAFEDRAIIGTHYHKALELLDFTSDYKQNTNFKDVDYNKIKQAHKTLSALTKDCVNIYKEADFEMYLPYNSVVESEFDDKVIVQGVVDLIIEKENSVIIIDYKFSKLPIHVLKEKYKEQLSLYKKAVESAFKKKVENMFIYSLETGELA